MYKIEETGLSNLLKIEKTNFMDDRGLFSKTFSKEHLIRAGLNGDLSEVFYSVSKKDVIRGMHYQKRPFEHDKIVSVVDGAILDVVVNVERNTEHYGQWKKFFLSSDSGCSIYIGAGYAHGFLTLTDSATVLYQTTSSHNLTADTGVNWQSFGFEWPVAKPIISDRDKSLPMLGENEW